MMRVAKEMPGYAGKWNGISIRYRRQSDSVPIYEILSSGIER